MDKSVIKDLTNDISYIAKRYKGLIEASEHLKDISSLLNQKDEMTKTVSELKETAVELKGTMEAGLKRIAGLDESIKMREAQLLELDKEYNATEDDMKNDIANAEKKAEDIVDLAEEEAKDIRKKAMEDAEVMIKSAESEAKKAEDRVNKAEAKIRKMRESL